MNKNVLNTDLSGKVAVVTGAAGVLCSNFSRVLARAGARVALLDLNLDAAEKFAAEIRAEGGIAEAFSCNVLDRAVCEETAKAVEEEKEINIPLYKERNASSPAIKIANINTKRVINCINLRFLLLLIRRLLLLVSSKDMSILFVHLTPV